MAVWSDHQSDHPGLLGPGSFAAEQVFKAIFDHKTSFLNKETKS
jgi:hypothetical protein